MSQVFTTACPSRSDGAVVHLDQLLLEQRDIARYADAADAASALFDTIRDDRYLQRFGAPPDREHELLAGAGLDSSDQLLPAGDRLGVDGDNHIPGAQASALPGFAGERLADDRGREPSQADLVEEVAVRSAAPSPDRSSLRKAIWPFSFCTSTSTLCLSTACSSKHPAHFLPGGDRLVADTQDRLAGGHTGLGRRRGRKRGPQHRLDPGTPCMNSPVHEIASRKLAIGPAARWRSGDRRLAVERSIALLRCNLAFPLVQHLHVAAERKRGDDPLGLVGSQAPAPKRRAESHREAQHLDAAQPRDGVVTELVDHDERCPARPRMRTA